MEVTVPEPEVNMRIAFPMISDSVNLSAKINNIVYPITMKYEIQWTVNRVNLTNLIVL